MSARFRKGGFWDKPDTSPQPEMPEGWHYSPAIGGVFVSKREDGGQYALSIKLMHALLATQGLTIVGPAERALPEVPERSMDHAWFCPQCGLRDETDGGLDGDGTCSSCGCDCCTWNSLNSHLAHMGWHVITTEQRAVLDAALALPEKQLRAALIGKPFRASHVLREFAESELARRAAKEGT